RSGRPELVFGLLVALEFAEGDGLSILDLPDVDLGTGPPLGVALSGHGGEDDHAVGVRHDLVGVNAKRAAGERHALLQEMHHAFMALVLARQGAAPRDMPCDVVGENVEDGRDVTSSERLVATSDQLSIGVGHFWSPLLTG